MGGLNYWTKSIFNKCSHSIKYRWQYIRTAGKSNILLNTRNSYNLSFMDNQHLCFSLLDKLKKVQRLSVCRELINSLKYSPIVVWKNNNKSCLFQLNILYIYCWLLYKYHFNYILINI